MVETVGTPVFHHYVRDLQGSWMVDSKDPIGEEGSQKVKIVIDIAKKLLYIYRYI